MKAYLYFNGVLIVLCLLAAAPILAAGEAQAGNIFYLILLALLGFGWLGSIFEAGSSRRRDAVYYVVQALTAGIYGGVAGYVADAAHLLQSMPPSFNAFFAIGLAGFALGVAGFKLSVFGSRPTS